MLRVDVVIRFMLFAYTDTLVVWDIASKGRLQGFEIVFEEN